MMNIEEAVAAYSNMLYKICIVMLCNEQDAQDAIQETFCRYLEKKPDFTDSEHEKAWLIQVITNICRDMLRFRSRHPKVSIDEITDSYASSDDKDILTELLDLPIRHRTVIYLYYVEGYQVREVASLLKISEHAVKKRLQRGREQLRLSWKEAYEE